MANKSKNPDALAMLSEISTYKPILSKEDSAEETVSEPEKKTVKKKAEKPAPKQKVEPKKAELPKAAVTEHVETISISETNDGEPGLVRLNLDGTEKLYRRKDHADGTFTFILAEEEVKETEIEKHFKQMHNYEIVIGEKVFDVNRILIQDQEATEIFAEYKKTLADAAKKGIQPIYRKKRLEFETRYKDGADDMFVRQTYYLTYDEVCAIEKITYKYRCKKSDLVRKLLDSALEEYYPGVLAEVANDAQSRRNDDYDQFTEKMLKKRNALLNRQ